VRKLYSARVPVRVLLTDQDDPDTLVLAELLEQSRFSVTIASPSTEETTTADMSVFDAVTMGMRERLGGRIERCRSLRELGYAGAILALCEDAAEGEALLDAGADDFVAAPLKPSELTARLRASIRRAAARHRLRWGALELDRLGRLVRVRGRSVALTARECELLARLIEASGKVVSRATLRKQVWHGREDRGTNLVEVHLSRLRDKLGEDAAMIETVRGVGYRLRR
jgi:two-component system, OmpR family, response regulator